VQQAGRFGSRHEDGEQRDGPRQRGGGAPDSRGGVCSAGADLRRVDHDQRVDPRRCRHRPDRLFIFIRARLREQHHRVVHDAGRGHQSGERRLHLIGELRHAQPAELARVGAQHTRAARVGDDADAIARRQGLLAEQLRRAEQLRQGRGADDPGLLEKRVLAHVRGGDTDRRWADERSRMGRGRGASPGRRTASFDGEDRCRAGDATGDARELARVPERLEVEHHQVRARIGLPVLKEVGPGDVGVVADRDEG